MDYVLRAREVLNIEIEALSRVRDDLSDDFAQAATLMMNSLAHGGKIVLTGVGKSLHIAQKISATLSSTGATSVVLNPTQAIHGDLGMVGPQDVLLALSYSGASEEILAILPSVKRIGAKIIAMTGTADSALAQHSDVVISVKIAREACPYNMAPTASTTATLAVGDALAMVLLEARGFQKEDYAKLHPGGAIGRALLLRVCDIMRSGDRLACVKKGARVKDALLAMTQARAGSCGVVDNQGKALGIFTDGDLRRHVADQSDILNVPIEEVMTPSPIAVQSEQLAIDVLKIYEDHNIDDLLVVDEEGRLIGAVDIQDLPKLKIL